MKYAYEDLSEDQFEKLAVFLCQELLGAATQGFAKGPDGGRDAKFVGTAQLIPSTSAPWNGTTIIQAKHTVGHNKAFAESDFYSPDNKTCTIAEEIPRIKTLRASGELDHYLLFANRKLTGGAQKDITDAISRRCGIPHASIFLCGIEQLEMWLKKFPKIPALVDLDPVDSPLIISPDELAAVVEALARNKTAVTAGVQPPTGRVTYERKNKLNKMTQAYAKEQRRKFLKETPKVAAFLAAPENSELLTAYENAVDEFQLKILSKKKDYQSFDEIMEYLVKLLYERDPILSQRHHRRLTRVVLFHMYWSCDIGETEDAQT